MKCYSCARWTCGTQHFCSPSIEAGEEDEDEWHKKLLFFNGVKQTGHTFIFYVCLSTGASFSGQVTQYLLEKFIHQHPWENKSESIWILDSVQDSKRSTPWIFSRAQKYRSLRTDSPLFCLSNWWRDFKCRTSENVLRRTKLPRPSPRWFTG